MIRQISRESWAVAGLLVLLVGLTIVAAIYQAKKQEQVPPLASFSSTQDGARALWLWLEQLGYPIGTSERTFSPTDGTGTLLVLEPTEKIETTEWQVIDAWIAKGGTLIVAGDGWGAASAFDHFGFQTEYLVSSNNEPAAQTPLLASPPLTTTGNTQAVAYIHPTHDPLQAPQDPFVTHLAIDDQPLLISLDRQAGRVLLCTIPFVFSNAGLKEPGNPELALNTISATRHPGTIWFDEWHHGLQPQSSDLAGPVDWLRFTPAGHALLYVAIMVFLRLVLQGRRFGRPVPRPQDIIRRTPLEYINAIANLNRRAGHRKAVLQHYYQQLKRELGKRYRLDPALPDREYVAQLAQYNASLDIQSLNTLLQQLRGASSESDMIQAAAQVAKWLKES